MPHAAAAPDVPARRDQRARQRHRKQVRQHAAQVVEPVGDAPSNEVGRPHEALPACPLNGEPLEAQPSVLLDEHEAAHAKRAEPVAGRQPEHEVPRLVDEDLQNAGNDQERDGRDEPGDGAERVARAAAHGVPDEVAARGAGRHEQHDGKRLRSPLTLPFASLCRHAPCLPSPLVQSRLPVSHIAAKFALAPLAPVS